MSVENLMHPPRKCNCDCCCNCQPRTCGPLPKQEWPESVKRQIGERITEVMETGKPSDLAAPQQAIPSGWKLVPIEPTEEMITAACDCQDHDPADDYDSEIFHAYKAMLNASPTAPIESDK
jgi:hypothetical protein